MLVSSKSSISLIRTVRAGSRILRSSTACLDEADARNRFARLRGAVEGSGPITLRATGPPHLYGPSGDVPPYQMRGLGIMYSGAPAYDDLWAHLAASFDESGSSFPHTSLVYDWIGSPRVTGAVADAIRA